MKWDEEHATPWARAFLWAACIDELERVVADEERSARWRHGLAADLPAHRYRARREIQWALRGMWSAA
jgi:hypothetical protein